MATIIKVENYNCFDDCLISGCPTHEAKLTFQTVSSCYVFENGKGEVFFFEKNELEVLVKMLKEIKREDSIKV